MPIRLYQAGRLLGGVGWLSTWSAWFGGPAIQGWGTIIREHSIVLSSTYNIKVTSDNPGVDGREPT